MIKMHTLLLEGKTDPTPLGLVSGSGSPVSPLRPTQIGKFFEIVTQKCNKTKKLGTPPPEFFQK